MSFSTRPLFGGALSCAIPDDFVDVRYVLADSDVQC